MPSKLFIASMIEEQQANHEMELAWLHILHALPEGISGVQRKQPHLTMRFLGPVDTEQPDNANALQAMNEGLKEITSHLAPIELHLGATNTFPGAAYVAVEGTAEAVELLDDLARQVEVETGIHFREAGMGSAIHIRPFSPHLTLGTFPPENTPLIEQHTRRTPTVTSAGFTLRTIQLISSQRNMADVTIYRPAGPEIPLGNPQPIGPSTHAKESNPDICPTRYTTGAQRAVQSG